MDILGPTPSAFQTSSSTVPCVGVTSVLARLICFPRYKLMSCKVKAHLKFKYPENIEDIEPQTSILNGTGKELNVCNLGGSFPHEQGFFSLSPYPDQLWDPFSLLSNEYQGLLTL
jgi:hypothetical protein